MYRSNEKILWKKKLPLVKKIKNILKKLIHVIYVIKTIVKNYCHITGEYRGSTNQSCSATFPTDKKIPVILHNLKGYDSHLIMQEICKFDKKTSITLNSMVRYMALMLGKNLDFIDSMQFIKSILEKSVHNLSKDKSKYLSQELFRK